MNAKTDAADKAGAARTGLSKQLSSPVTDRLAEQDPDPDPASGPDSHRPTLLVDCDMRDADWQELRAALTAQATHVWDFLSLPAAEVSLVLADNAFSAQLNENYRGKTGPTNVLSFPAQDFTAPVRATEFATLAPPRLLGDIVLAHGLVHAEAAAQNKSPEAHAQHLLTHGLLHLIGHDHQQPQPARVMEHLEIEILAAQGMVDPYQPIAAEDGQ